jgi:hypothetical protein
LRGNILYWCSGGENSHCLMAKSIDMRFENNIIADCDMVSFVNISKFNWPAYGQVIRRNIFTGKVPGIYPTGPTTTSERIKECDFNLFFPEAPGLDRARGLGWDEHSMVADPLFDRKNPVWDATYTDYRVKPGSPAEKIGFRQIDVDKIGLLEDFPFDRGLMYRKDAAEPWQAEYHDRIYRGRTYGGKWRPGRPHTEFRSEEAHVYHMEDGSWTRYSNMDFGDGRLKRFTVCAQYNAPETDKDAVAIEVRLDAPDGEVIGRVTNGADGCDIQRVDGIHRLFLVFRGNRIKTLDCFQFQAAK